MCDHLKTLLERFVSATFNLCLVRQAFSSHTWSFWVLLSKDMVTNYVYNLEALSAAAPESTKDEVKEIISRNYWTP